MKKKEKAQFIQEILNALFPLTPIPLYHRDPYTLLVAVLLSAQCTDVRVNLITPLLFEKAATPKQMIALEVKEIEAIIRPCGLAPTKARAIWQLSFDLIAHFQGEVPKSFDDLESLPGVGHKTASVVMAQAFGVPAFPVDTHIHRLAKRWKISNAKNVLETERDLKLFFPKSSWNKLHLQMIYFGRQYCPARGHKERECPICSRLDESLISKEV